MRISVNSQKLDLTRFQSGLLAFVLSAAVFLSVSTNLRINGLPVGVGEIGLMLFMLASLLLNPWQKMSSPLFLFWISVWVCTALGYAFGNVVGNLRLHNAVAYVYTGGLTLAFLSIFDRLESSDLRRILFYFVSASVLSLWLGLVAYLGLDSAMLDVLRIDTSENGRYQGWCQNANQMSLLLVPMPFLVLDLWSTSVKNSNWYRLGWVVLLLLSVVMGFVVRSAALTASWGLGLVVLIVLNFKQSKRLQWVTVLAVLMIFAVGLLSVRTLTQQGYLGASVQNNALQVGVGTVDQKVDIRFQLWKNALKVWEKSPIVGHGPGAYSNFDLTKNQNFSGMEAHNTLIDLMVQGGLLLALAYFGLFVWLMITLWRTEQWILMISALMLFSFEFFMFHLRQPVIWFYLTLILALAKLKAPHDR